MNRALPETTAFAWVCLICSSDGRSGREANSGGVEG